MKYTHLFWDFDGTLYNSYPQIIAAMQRTLKECDLPHHSSEEILPLLKHSVFFTVSSFAEAYSKPIETLMKCFRRHHALEISFPPYDGLDDCLRTLSAAGCRHYLYTHRDRLAISLLQRDGLWELFSGAVTSDDGFPHKPAPDALLSLIDRYGLDVSHCIMIGDRGIDIESGSNAGMDGAVFDPEGMYFGPEVSIKASSMAELTRMLLEA